jgi:hypothetical protein
VYTWAGAIFKSSATSLRVRNLATIPTSLLILETANESFPQLQKVHVKAAALYVTIRKSLGELNGDSNSCWPSGAE